MFYLTLYFSRSLNAFVCPCLGPLYFGFLCGGERKGITGEALFKSHLQSVFTQTFFCAPGDIHRLCEKNIQRQPEFERANTMITVPKFCLFGRRCLC